MLLCDNPVCGFPMEGDPLPEDAPGRTSFCPKGPVDTTSESVSIY